MITMEDWIIIKNLKSKNPSIGSRMIANLLGISSNTIQYIYKKRKLIQRLHILSR